MACEICGRNSCTRSFHSLDDQKDFDLVADDVKDKMKEVLKRQIERLKDKGGEFDEHLVSFSEVIDIIDSYS